MPILSTGTYAVGSLTIQAGARISQSGGKLQVHTGVTNNGQYLGTGGTIEMVGSAVALSGAAQASYPTIAVKGGSTVTMSTPNACAALTLLYEGSTATFRHTNSASLTVSGNVTLPTFPQNNTQKIWDIGSGSATVGGSLYIGSGQELNVSNRFAKVIVTTGTLSVDGDLVFNANAAQPGNAVLEINGGAATVNIGGNTTLVNNVGTITPGTASTVNFDGASAQTINFSSNLRYHHIRINNAAGVRPGVAITSSLVAGNLSVQSGLFDNNGLAIAGSSSRTFTVSNDATFRISGGGMVTGFGSRVFQPASTVNYSSAFAQTVSAETYGHLTLSGGGTKTMPSSALTMEGNFTIAGTASVTILNSLNIKGDVTLGADAYFNPGSFTHNVGGDLTNNGINLAMANTKCVFNGNQNQVIGGTAVTAFYELIVNKPAGEIQLSNDMIVSEKLTFTKGIITTNGFEVNIPNGSEISGAGADKGWVNGNLLKYFSGNGYFEIGTATSYLPVQIEFSSLTTPGYLSATTVSAKHPSIASSNIANNSLSRYWSIVPYAGGAPVFSTCKLTFLWTAGDTYPNFSTSSLMLARFKNGSWSYPALDGAPSATELKGTLVPSALGDFTIGQACAANFSYSAASFCSTVGTATAQLATGARAGVFSSTPAGLSLNSSTGTINLAASNGGTYSVTNTISGTCSSTFTTSVTVVKMPTATIAYPNTPYCNSGTAKVVMTGTTGGVFSSTAGLFINASNGDVDLSKCIPGVYSVTYTVAANGGCAQFQTTSLPFTIGGNTWKGTVSADWHQDQNWSCGSKPSSSDSIVIPVGTPNYPLVSNSDASVKDISIAAGASLKVQNKRLEILGKIIGNGGFEVSNNAKLDFKGTSAQTIPASVFTNNSVPNLTINNEAGVTLMGPLDVTHILEIEKGTLYTNDHLTLKSSAANTARLGEVKSSAAQPIVGEVTVERYVPGRRKYRLVASSVTTSPKSVLNGTETGKSIWGNWQNAGINEAGKGTLITGGSTTDGFDSQTSNASLFTYNETTKRFVAFSTANGKSTKATPLKTGQAYYMFVYGDRLNKISAANPSPTVLRSKGTLAVGPQTFNGSSAVPLTRTIGNFTLIGNPYACTVDWKSVQKSGVSSTIWGWDANLSSTGGYVTVTATLTGALVSPVSPLIQSSRYIQPGQGFFVKTTGSNPQIVINESNKINDEMAINSNVFRTTGNGPAEVNTQPLLAVNLLYNSGGSPVLADGAVAAFDPAFSKEVTEDDGQKMANSAEVVSLVENGVLLSIDTRPMPQANDTLELNLAKLTKAQYTLEIFAQDLGMLTAMPLLQDTYLDKIQPLSLTDTNRINFTVSASDPASSSAGRFRIIFHPLTTLPVTFVSVAANKKDRQVVVDWKVANEPGTVRYEIERSTDGSRFLKVGEQPAGASALSYQWLDSHPASGNNWYRIRSVEGSSQYQYSKTVMVTLPASKAAVVVVPNPVIGRQINVQIREMEKGLVQAYLFDQRGTEILRRTLEHRGGTGSYIIASACHLTTGLYYLKLVGKTETFTLEILIE